jgi:hypothetical protein
MTEAKHKTPAVPARVKLAVAHLMKAGEYDIAGAARAAGMDIVRLRFALGKSYVRKYMREQRLVEIEALCQGNAAALAKVRDTSENGMAVKAAEQIRSQILSEDGARGSTRPMPGLVIQIVGSARIEPQQPQRLASVPRIEDLAFERKPDKDDDLLAGNIDDELLDEPARDRRGTD